MVRTAALAALAVLLALVWVFGNRRAEWSSCTLPVEAALGVRRHMWWPRRIAGFRSPLGLNPNAFLVQEVAAWSGETLLAASDDAAGPARNRTCGTVAARSRQAESTTSGGAAYRAWAARLGRPPFEATLARLPGKGVSSSALFQRGGCPQVAQRSAFHCPVAEVRRAVLDGVTLRADGAAGPSALLLPRLRPETNPYHVLLISHAFDAWCVWEAAADLRRAGVPRLHLASEAGAWRGLPPWQQGLLAALLPVHLLDARNASSARFGRLFQPLAGAGPGLPFRTFELDRAADLRLRRMPAAVLARLLAGVGARRAGPPTVLVAQRSHNRRLVGSVSGSSQARSPPPQSPHCPTPRLSPLASRAHQLTRLRGCRGSQELLRALCAEGLRAREVVFDKLPLWQQVRHAATAAVMVGVHGAQLANLIFMDAGASVVEVTLRYGWCCVWQDKRRPAESPCGDTCVPYFKGDYANLAHAMGLRYVYIDPAFASPQLGEPIWRMSVHVAAAPLARVARLLLRDQSDSRGDVLRTV